MGLVSAVFLAAGFWAAPAPAPVRLVQTIALPGVRGRIAHLAADVAGKRLFVAAVGNDTVEVIDVKAGRRARTIAGLHEPRGIAYVAEANRIYVANSLDGKCHIYDSGSYALLEAVDISGNADNVRYDGGDKRIYVGYGRGGIAVLDARTGKRIGEIALNAHPESFQLESAGPRLFANVPILQYIAVIDRRKREITARWPLAGADLNHPMALDEAHQRLFAGCRTPARVLVYDMRSGKVVASIECAGDADDMYYDAVRQRLYVAGGEGNLNVIEQSDPDHYKTLGKIATAAGARTGLLVPEWKRFYLAVPQRGSQGAEIRVYE